jgi:hypothetical protein
MRFNSLYENENLLMGNRLSKTWELRLMKEEDKKRSVP